MDLGKKGKGGFISHERLALRDKVKENISEVIPQSISEDLEKTKFLDSGFKTVQVNIFDLPSKFLPYPKDAIIKYRPYFFEEIKNHDQSKNLMYREEVEYVLSGVYTNFDKYKLTLSDYLYLNLLRRLSNLGEYDIRAKYRCGGCNNLSESIFKASSILIDYLEVPELPVRVTLTSGKEYNFSPLTIGSYLKMVEEKFKNKDVSMLSRCCVDAPYEEIYEVIRTLTDPVDIALVEHLDSLLYHSLVPMKLKCTHKFIKPLENEDGWSLDKLNSLKVLGEDEPQLISLFNKYKIKFVKGTGMFKYAFKDLVKKMALIEEIPCGHLNSVELDGGDLFIGPFCNYGELIKNRIRYGV